MNEVELNFILQEGESYFIEFKQNISKSISKEMIAFANASGGRIFIGIDDKGNIPGINITNSLKSRINDFAKNCSPSVTMTLSEYKNVLIINIPEGKDKPYQCSEGFYIRMGANAQKMTREQIIEFLQSEGKVRFEEQYDSRFNFNMHYDANKLNDYPNVSVKLDNNIKKGKFAIKYSREGYK